MSVRQLPAALLLGLLASLVAHAAGFGAGHVEGGAYHAIIETLALVGGALALVLAMVAAFCSTGGCADGSVVSSRLAGFVPRFGLVAVTALGWFGLIESLEPAHAAGSLAVILVALLVASIAIRLLALGALRLISAFAFAVARLRFNGRRPAYRRNRSSVILARALLLARRHVTRPPPLVHLASA